MLHNMSVAGTLLSERLRVPKYCLSFSFSYCRPPQRRPDTTGGFIPPRRARAPPRHADPCRHTLNSHRGLSCWLARTVCRTTCLANLSSTDAHNTISATANVSWMYWEKKRCFLQHVLTRGLQNKGVSARKPTVTPTCPRRLPDAAADAEEVEVVDPARLLPPPPALLSRAAAAAAAAAVAGGEGEGEGAGAADAGAALTA